jgi:putative salt-induced outer membrane protein YdiY
MSRHFTAIVALAVAVTGAGVARAQDKPTHFTGDLSYVQTGGNTDVLTVSGADKLEHVAGKWKFTQEGGAVWGETEGVESAGRYGLSLRGDYALSERLSAYGLASWRRNVFAGISRQFDEGVGLSYHALVPATTPSVTQPHQLDLEVGAGVSQRRTTLGVEDNFGTARTAALYQYYFAEKTFFEAGGAYLINLNDTEDSEARGRVALTAPLSENFGLKVGYEVAYRNQPLPGFEKTDTTFSAGLQVTY